MLLCPDCALLRPKLSPKNERMWKASCGHKGRHRPESKFYPKIYIHVHIYQENLPHEYALKKYLYLIIVCGNIKITQVQRLWTTGHMPMNIQVSVTQLYIYYSTALIELSENGSNFHRPFEEPLNLYFQLIFIGQLSEYP